MSIVWQHEGLDCSIHDGPRDTCASCNAMEEDGFGDMRSGKHVATDGFTVHEGRPGVYCSICKTIGQAIADDAHVVEYGQLGIVVPDKGMDEDEAKLMAMASTAFAAPNDDEAWYDQQKSYDPVNPPHYKRGPVLTIDIGERITQGKSKIQHNLQCIEVVRYIPDFRLAQAIRYIWRVAFGGKMGEDDQVDIDKAIWYLTDWKTHRHS